jgi:hypothetical protein
MPPQPMLSSSWSSVIPSTLQFGNCQSLSVSINHPCCRCCCSYFSCRQAHRLWHLPAGSARAGARLPAVWRVHGPPVHWRGLRRCANEHVVFVTCVSNMLMTLCAACMLAATALHGWRDTQPAERSPVHVDEHGRAMSDVTHGFEG